MSEDHRHGPSPSPRYEFGLQEAKVSHWGFIALRRWPTLGPEWVSRMGHTRLVSREETRHRICSNTCAAASCTLLWRWWFLVVAKSPRVGKCGPRKA